MRPLLASILTVLIVAAAAPGFGRRAVRWNVAGTSSEAPRTAGTRVLLVNGDWIRCHELSGGRQLWAKRFEGLVGESLSTAGRRAFLLAKGGLFELDTDSGKLTRHRALIKPQSLVASTTLLVVSDATGTYWLDLQGNVTAHSPRRGALRGLAGQQVVLFVEQRLYGRSPKRLLVVDPSQPKPVQTFKLLARGKHALLQFDPNILSFADHYRGSKRHKLYLTTITLPSGEKRDLSLGKLFAPEQPQLGFAQGAGAIFVSSFGGRSDHSEKTLLVAIDPHEKKVSWKRRGLALSTGPGLSSLGVLVGVSRDGAAGAVKVFDPQTGTERSTQPLDAAPMWPPLVAGPCLLVQTHSSLYCLDVAPTPVAAAPSAAAGTWQLHQDPVINYKLSVPSSWKLARKHVRKLGGKRYSLPFVRYLRRGSRWILQGTIHLLVRESAGQSTEGFWRSVAAFRQRQDPAMRVLQRDQRMLAGKYQATIARYEMHNRAGAVEQWRSLCLVHRGVAYELRAWSSPLWEQQIWPEVEKIMETFAPQR